MKRLIRNAVHDVHNRDTAILYVNGKFYEDLTHALCTNQFISENGYDYDINALQYRPAVSLFIDMSNTFGPIVLGHRVDKEEAVYLIYGVINGEVLQFDGIPSNIISEFENYYNMPVKDDMKHDDSEGNEYDGDEQWQKTKDRIYEVGKTKPIVEKLEKEYGFVRNELNSKYISNGAMMIVPGNDADGSKAMVCVLGGKKQFIDNKNLIEFVENVDISLYEYIIQLNGEVKVAPPIFFIEIPNKDGDIIKIINRIVSGRLVFENYRDFDYDKKININNLQIEDINKLLDAKLKGGV